ncbi:MAG TPA: AAA family ATPase [Dehalococcoidales bacterium]|nr:AAA family ATPase [Dehalococcoidales bacterium]
MNFNIAVAGKGGSGKTSLASLVIRYLQRSGASPILAIDADPNANLGDSLGLKVGQTVGSVIASFNEEKINIPPGMTKEDYLEFQISDALTESKGLDLLTMGRGEGPECYCYPNLMLRRFADKLSESYAYVVMDNEAGMEHLSRRTTQNIDELLLVSDHSIKGIRTIARLKELVGELELVVKRQSVVINLVPDGIDPHISQEIKRLGLELTAVVPLDKAVYEADLNLTPLLELPDTAKAVIAVNDLMAKLLK